MTRPCPIAAHVVTLAGILDVRARETPESLAFAMSEESISYRTLLEDAERIGKGLRHRGVGHADRVAVLLPAGLGVVRLFFALQRIGAVPCLFDPGVPAATSARRIARIRPRLTIVATWSDDARSLTAAGLSTASLDDVLAGSSSLPPLAYDREAIAFLQPTSGTSGEPRAAVILQRNVLASLQSAREMLDPGEHDVLVGWVPPWHDLGLLRFLVGPVYFGIPCHLVPPAVRTIPQWFSTISRVRGTITGAPDFAYRLAARLVDPESVDLSSLRYATNGGEPVRRSTITSFETRFGLRDVVRPGYGLAEATLGVTSVRSGETVRSDARGNVSTGRALEGVEVRIETGSSDTAGEILVRGPAVFAGYFEAEEATAEVMRDGWLHTGDVGSLDSDGRLFVLGRRRAMLKRGGATLAPREFEEAAQTVDGVRIAAAIGIAASSDSLTEDVVVVVEAHRDIETVATRVSEAVERAMGFAPDRVVVQQPRTIPRTTNGKIRHAVLRQQLIAKLGSIHLEK